MLRIRTAPGRFHAFPVQARVDQYPGARLRFRRRPADGPKGFGRAAVIVIRRCGIGRADMNLPRPYGLFLPEFERIPVREQG